MRFLLPLLLLFLLCTGARAQDADERGTFEPFENWTLRPIFAVQGWATYTHDFEEWDAETGAYVPVDNRLNFMLRRLRFGTTAQVGERIFIKFLGAADFVGADQRAGTVGGVNNGGFPNAQIWDIYARYQLIPKSEALYVIGGYLRPPIGRESMSGAFGVSSFEKSFVQWYVRQHLVGVGPGGTGGAYLGGIQSLGEKFHIDYRAGVFNPQNNGISAGRRASSLWATRINLMFGDREKGSWTYGLPAANSFGARNVTSVALNLANEGPTGAVTDGTGLIGVDFLANYGQWHLEGEFHSFQRRQPTGADYQPSAFSIRTGFNIPIRTPDITTQRYLEPSVLFWGFNGATELDDYAAAQATNYFAGEERVLDVGLNYHLRPGKVRIGLHYNATWGELGEVPADGTNLGLYHFQGGVGGIRRGSYVGFEFLLSY